MSRRRTIRILATLLLAAGLGPTTRDAAAQAFPIPGMAPGSQTATVAPFTGLARSPEADLFTGTASASVAVEVPPGRGNMTPQLILGYSSTGGTGPVGHGWNLGVGRISRSLKHGVPAYDDALDTFVLELPGSVTELVRVKDDLYRPRHQGSYLKILHEQSRNSWKVFDKDGTLYVFGHDPLGRNSRSGPDTTDAATTFAWLLEQIVDPWGNSIDFVYDSASEITGPGRLASVHYGGNTRRPGSWPGSIPHLFRVELTWSAPPAGDPLRRTYEAGFSQVTDDRIALVRISTLYKEENGSERTARVYDLGYETDPATHVRRLSTVALAATGDNGTTVLPTTVFEYAPSLQIGYPVGQPSSRQAVSLSFGSPGPLHDRGSTIRFDTFDIDADGLVDYVDHSLGVRFGSGGGSGFEPSWTAWAWPAGHPHVRRINNDVNIHENVFDVNGDALPDFVDATTNLCEGRCPTCDSNCWNVYLNTGTGFASSPVAWPAPAPLIRDSGTSGSIHRDTIDLDGDGLPDFVDAKNAPAGFWDVYRNTGSGFDLLSPMRWQVPAVGDRISHAFRSGSTTFTWSGLIDLNGDGLPDLLSALPDYPAGGPAGFDHTERWVVHYNNGSGFEAAVDWRVEGAAPGQAWLLSHYGRDKSGTTAKTFSDLVDMTGDGLPDLVRRYEGNDGGLPQPACPAGIPVCGPGTDPPACCVASLLFINTGSSFAPPVALPAWHDEQTLRSWDDGAVPAAGREFDLFDFDGDGLIDLVERVGSSWHVYRHPASPYAAGSSTPAGLRYKPDILVSMMNGVGGETFLEYSPVTLLADQRCAHAADGEPIAGRCLPFPHWVVTARTHTDPSSPVPAVETSHLYTHPYYAAAEREFRGFAAVWSIDRSGRSEVRGFHQDTARKGLVTSIDTLGKPDCEPSDPDDPADPCSPWNAILASTLNTWSNGPVLLTETTTVPYIHGPGGATPAWPAWHLARGVEYDYDDYGNEIKRAITGYGHRYVVKTTYDPRDSKREYIVNKPASTRSYGDAGKQLVYKLFRYKHGTLTRSDTCRLIDGNRCIRWSKTKIKLARPAGQVRKIKTPSRGVSKLTYDDDFLGLKAKRDPTGLVTEYTYDRRVGRYRREKFADGRVREADRDGLGRPIALRGLSRSGVLFTEASTEYVEPIPTLGILGHTRIDVVGQAPVVTFHDGLGRRIATKTLVDATDSGTVAVVSGLRSYDDAGRISAEATSFQSPNPTVGTLTAGFTDSPADERTFHEYDDRTGKLVRTLYPDGTSIRFERRVPGFNAITDANLSEELAGGSTPTACTGGTGSVEINTVDALGRMIRTEQCAMLPDLATVAPGAAACPSGCLLARTHYDYDALDRLTAVYTDSVENGFAYLTTRYEYDGLGDRTLVDDTDSGLWTTEYTASGQVGTQTDPQGRSLRYRYDKADRITSKSAADFDATYTYHAAGSGAGKVDSITTRVDGSLRARRTLRYDRRGVPDRESLEIRTPSEDGTRTSSWTFDRTYDLADRIISTTYPAPEGIEVVTTTYSGFGRPLRLTSSERVYVENVTYDLHDRIVAIQHGNGVTDRYGYASQAELGSLRCMSSASSDGSSGTGGPLCAGGGLSSVEILSRDAIGRITSVRDTSAGDDVPHSASAAFTYDELGRLTSATYPDGSADAYAYDSTGNISSRNGSGYVYDTISPHPHQLLQVGTTLFTHDRSGNRTRKGAVAYSYDDLNRLSTVSDAGVEIVRYYYGDTSARIARHDLSSNTLIHYFNGQFEIDTDSGVMTRHFYLGDRQVASDRVDAPDAIVEALAGARATHAGSEAMSGPVAAVAPPPSTLRTTPAGPGAPPVQAPSGVTAVALRQAGLAGAAIAIGLMLGLGNRRRRAALACAVLYAGTLVLAPPAPARTSLPSFPGRTSHATVADTTVFYHLDQVGSPRLVTGSAGEVIEHLRYRAYGELRGAYDARGELRGTGYGSTATELGFTGAQIDAAAGLIDFGARFYDPETALFLTVDPMEQFASPYTYSGFDPINSFDPDGRFLPLLIGAAFLAKPSTIGIAAAVAGTTTFVQTLVRSGDLGASLQAGIIAGASSAAFSAIGPTLVAASGATQVLDAGRAAMLRAAASGFGAAQSFREGNVASGLASVFSFISGLRPDDGTSRTGVPGASIDVAADGVPATGAVVAAIGHPLASRAGEPLDHELWLAARSTERDGKIGHSFVALGQTGGELEVYGFYPDGPLGPGLKGLTQTVDGQVVAGVDASGLARAIRGTPGYAAMKYTITRSQFDAALGEVNRYRGLSYNAARCNCTSFALDVARAAGVAPPYGGIVPRPAALLRSIRRLQRR